MRQAITERHVQALWYDGAFRPRALRTRRGAEVHVVYPGKWNLGPGPDFLGAVIELGRGRRRVTGDVEVHLAPGDWTAHGHGGDPLYANVIAHVTWGCGHEPATLPPGAVSIWLGRFLLGDAAFSPDAIDLLAYPYARLPAGRRPCEAVLSARPEAAIALLASAGRSRLQRKARRIRGRLAGPDAKGEAQVFYEEVMNALGYRRNSAPFRRVAERLPIDCLPGDAAAARSAMLVAGGFEEWDRTGVRPWNTPERRLENAASIFTVTPMMEYARETHFGRGELKAMIRALCDGHFLGRGRAGAILANVVVPFALAGERASAIPDWLPPEDISEPVRLTAFRLFGRDHNPRALYANNGLLIQGLLQIHRDYCLQVHPDCRECSLVSEIG